MVRRAHQQQYRRIEPDVGFLSCASASRGADVFERSSSAPQLRPHSLGGCAAGRFYGPLSCKDPGGPSDADGHVPSGATRRRCSRPDLLYGKPLVDEPEGTRTISPNPGASGGYETVRVQSGLLQSVPCCRNVCGTRAGPGGTPGFWADTGELELPVHAWCGNRFGGVSTADAARCIHPRSSPVSLSTPRCGSRVELTRVSFRITFLPART